MRTTLFILLAISCLFVFSPAHAANKKDGHVKIRISKGASPEDASRALQLQHKLDSIQSLDYDALLKQDREKVKAEIADIKSEVKQMKGVYIYLSGGAILLIILLIILL